ncbi:hypothetical protein J6590_002850 [Homalodisca vitripennis]|nr:hypothetical protein J6590_002850 [Homalodisca vitripennis]
MSTVERSKPLSEYDFIGAKHISRKRGIRTTQNEAIGWLENGPLPECLGLKPRNRPAKVYKGTSASGGRRLKRFNITCRDSVGVIFQWEAEQPDTVVYKIYGSESAGERGDVLQLSDLLSPQNSTTDSSQLIQPYIHCVKVILNFLF